MNKCRKTFSRLLLAAAVVVGINCSASDRDPPVYRAMKSVSRWLEPLPLLYAQESDRRRDYDEMMRILLSLMARGDALVIMTPDGDYTTFGYSGPSDMVSEHVSRENLKDHFDTLQERYARVWVVLVDPRAGWHASPPAAYHDSLKQRYMELPLPMPTYFTDMSVEVGSTNFWLTKARILEKVTDMSSRNRNPRLYLRLGQVYRRYGKLGKAVETYERGIEHFHDDPFLHRELGECYYWEYSPPLLEESIKENRLANQYHIQKFGKPKYDAIFNIAMAYTDLGELTKAQLQYSDILRTLLEFPDTYFESQTRRYLGDTYLQMGQTNKAVLQFQLDIRLDAQPPGSSYNKLLDIYAQSRKDEDYAATARDYFYRCGTNDAGAIVRYTRYLGARGKRTDIVKTISVAKDWMRGNDDILGSIRARPDWWNSWTNLTLNHGFSPTP